MGVLDASTSPPKERYAVSKDNIIKLIQLGNVDGQLTEILRVPCGPRRSRPRSRIFSAGTPIWRPRTATSASCATITCRSAR